MTKKQRSGLQYAFGESPKFSGVVEEEIKQLEKEISPIRYVRQPSTKVFKRAVLLVHLLKADGVNSLIDSLINDRFDVERNEFYNLITKGGN